MNLVAAILLAGSLHTLLAEARDPIAKECAEAEIASVASLLEPDAPKHIERVSEQQIAKRYGHDRLAPWALAMYPKAKARMAGLLVQIGWIHEMRKKVDPTPELPLDQYFAKTARQKPVLGPVTKLFLLAHFRMWRKNFYYGDEILIFKTATPYFCSYFDLTRCLGPINDILTWMSPHVTDGQVVSMIDLWERVLNDTEYYPGLAKAAEIVFQRISGVRFRRDPRAAQSDIYSDLVAGYRAVGKSATEAHQRAMDILGVYGTRGASMGVAYSLARPETAQLLAPLTFLASAMSYLDLVQSENRYYSMPRAITGTCKYGKPYHFWMSAYFVDRLTRERKVPNVKSAAVASHIVGRVYESNSETYGRDPDQVFYEELLSPQNNRLRANLAFNDAGVLWAADRGQRPFSINGAIGLFKSEARPLPPMTPSELEALLKKPIERDKAWIRMFAPDALIRKWLESKRF